MVVALGLAVALVAMLQGGDDGGSGATSSPSATVNEDAARTEAHRLAAAVALRPEDWGSGYKRADPYETDPASEWEVRSTCEGVAQSSRSGTLAAISRAVTHPVSGLISSTEVRVFADPATAESYLDDIENGTRRCPEQHSDKTRWAGVRQATAPEVAGYDEIVAEDGKQVADADGKTTDYPYVVYTGRSGATTLAVIDYEGPDGVPARLAERAAGVMKKLQQRLEAAEQQ
ncbi:hypothetical protein ACGFYP_27625 [Streptomyces sp. NPDC048370]|uniref:hypothetical protein n=1 Tax=Streptomyces sp. NPDC048370 TaxID=3365540 RepID=UPI0037164B9D